MKKKLEKKKKKKLQKYPENRVKKKKEAEKQLKIWIQEFQKKEHGVEEIIHKII